ncbi:MAG TPA: mechanosensitive ion channel domain-containing protein [Saprospiraceae bacterium]|nr:mechanosensitive ion channel domain-containing protein [Saprospiraceae bacterium]
MKKLMDWFNDLSQNYPDLFDLLLGTAGFLGRVLGAILFFLVGRWVARRLARFFEKVLVKVGVDKLADKLYAIDMIGKSRLDILPSQVFGRVIYYIILFLVIWGTADIVKIAALSAMIEKLFEYLPTLFSAVLVFVAGLFLADFLKRIILSTSKSFNLSVGPVIANFIFYFLLINIAMMALDQAGIDTSAIKDNISIILGGFVAAFALGYGFASQPLLASMLSSYYNKKKISKGDHIKLDGMEGVIFDVDSTSITIIGDNETKTIIPLSKLLSEHYEIKKQGVVKMKPPSEPQD